MTNIFYKLWREPKLILKGLRKIRRLFLKGIRKIIKKSQKNSSDHQDLNLYWDSEMAQILETWGERNVWIEIQYLLYNCKGKVLDIACGTGKTIELISKFPQIKVYGCDISDFLISKAIERGIKNDRLTVCDATKTNYLDKSFEYAYSIGSLEHFTDDGIINFLSECNRIVRKTSFHMIPISRSGENEGWIKTYQSFHNNSTQWWLDKFNSEYKTVYVLDSTWEDDISIGKWFICMGVEDDEC